MAFFATMGLIAIAVGIPLIAMYACGRFASQKQPHPVLKWAAIIG